MSFCLLVNALLTISYQGHSPVKIKNLTNLQKNGFARDSKMPSTQKSLKTVRPFVLFRSVHRRILEASSATRKP
eukprot:4926374-Amphidinium_carterae.1